MRNDKMKKTAYLFEEIGRIDDRLLQEAMRFDCRTANTVKWRKILLIAATRDRGRHPHRRILRRARTGLWTAC